MNIVAQTISNRSVAHHKFLSSTITSPFRRLTTGHHQVYTRVIICLIWFQVTFALPLDSSFHQILDFWLMKMFNDIDAPQTTVVEQYLLNYIKVPSVYPATWGFY